MLFCRDHSVSVLHAWQHELGFLAGARDTQLADWTIQLRRLLQMDFHVLVRPFGGLAVPIDKGVVNLTLVLPGAPSLDAAFSALAEWIVAALALEGKVEVGEVGGSYCPGRFDLALSGQKFAGLAQRRINGVVAVSAFVNLFPASNDRALLMKDFYCSQESGQVLPPWVPYIDSQTTSDLYRLTGNVRYLDPVFLLQSMGRVHALDTLVPELSQLLAPYLPEAKQRWQGRGYLREWWPDN